MTLSIIVPVYNVRDYLTRCLDSLVNQTYQDKEIIIVDDGSNDGSEQIVDEYARRHHYIKTIHKANGGLMSAWTTGVRASKGDYIGFIDSDDYADPDMYEHLVSLAQNNQVDLVISDYKINGVDGKSKSKKHPVEDGIYKGDRLVNTIQMHVFPSPYTYSMSMSRMTKLFKREVLIDNLKYTECLSRTFEDRYITPAAILYAKSIYYTSSAYYNWMLREGSNHGMYKKNLLDDIKRVYEVQHRVVGDMMPALEQKWEEAFLDFIRLYVYRNIIKVKGFKIKKDSARQLIKDPMVKDRMKSYGHFWTDKTGYAVRLSLALNMPSLLALLSYFGSKNG